MSNIIPMVSSSPPPMDEGGGFEWDDDDDDFGTFTSANDNSFAQSDTTCTSKVDTSLPDHLNSDPHLNETDDFADFAMFPNVEKDPASKQVSKPQSGDQRPESINISHKSSDDEKTTDANTDKINNHTVNGPLSDSGVYSSNVSPVQCEENSYVNNPHNNIDGTRNSNSHPLHELPCSLSEKTSEKNEVLDTSDAGMTNCDQSVTDTQENVSFVNDSKTCVTESQDDSFKCIPPKDIPGNDHIHLSENVKTDDETVEHISTNVVIPNCDSDLVDSISSSDDVQSVSNISNQESCHEKNKDRIDLNEDAPDLKLDTKEEDIGEKDSDLDSCSSECVKQVENENTGCNNGVQRSELESESLQTVHMEDDKLRDQREDTVKVSMEDKNIDEESEDKNVHFSHEKSKSAVKDECETNIPDHERSDSESVNDNDVNDNTENKQTQISDESSDDKGISESNKDSKITEQMETINDCTFENDSNYVTDLKQFKDNGDDSENFYDNLQDGPISDNNNSNDCNKDVVSNLKVTVTENEEGHIVKEEDDGLVDFSTTNVDSAEEKRSDVGLGEVDSEESGDFNASFETKSYNDNFEVQEDEDFGDFNASFDSKPFSNTEEVAENDEEFGDFNATFPEITDSEAHADDDFGDFNATFDSTSNNNEQSSDWAAFSEPQTVSVRDDDDENNDEEDDWAGFEGGDSSVTSVSETVPTPHKIDESSKLANMTKHEKLIYAVTTCFPSLMSDIEFCDINFGELQDLHIDSASHVWGQVKGQETTEALSYQWTKSLWNSQLFSTLHIDTKNILIGHKKAPVPVYAAGLTLLEPTKGQAPLKPDVLVDTTNSPLNSTSQDSIPAAQFDWSSSGLTNPLEANNKTLNLDFLIQDQATKSNALESEFLSTNDSPVHKPSIQPLENILANLKTSSTYKPTSQQEDVSKEASKVLHSLPDLLFMKSKVLMFPVKLDGVEN